MVKKSRFTAILACTLILSGFFFPVFSQGAAAAGKTPLSDLENELTAIEKDLSDLEIRVDTLLEDLVNPKVSSLVLFFSATDLSGFAPAVLEVRLDDKPLATKNLSETDMLVLDDGGSIQFYSGPVGNGEHELSVKCILTPVGINSGSPTASYKKVFRISLQRTAANFVEITLSDGLDTDKQPFILTARHWYREP